MFVYHFCWTNFKLYIINYISQKCQIMLEQWTTQKSQWFRDTRDLFLCSAAHPLGSSVLHPSLSTKEFPSPCFHDWPGGQAWKLWQITGWLLELLFRASAQEWASGQISCIFMPKCKEKMQSYYFLKAENLKHWVDYTNDYHTDSITGTKLISIDYCLPNWNYKRLGNVPTKTAY